MTLILKSPAKRGFFLLSVCCPLVFNQFLHAGYTLQTIESISEKRKTPSTLDIKGKPR